MKIEVTKLVGNYSEFLIEVEPNEFLEHLKVAYQKVQKDVVVQGFRKGKVPQAIYEKKYGKEGLYQEGLDSLIQKVYQEALSSNPDIMPVAYPKVEVVAFEPDKEIKIKITVAVKPVVKLGKYKGIVSKPLDMTVSSDDVKQETGKILERYAEMELKEAPAELGDTVVMDFEGFKDKEAFEGGKGENHSLELGSNSFIPGFEEQLVGAKEGDELKVKVTFPKQYHAADLAGQPAVFHVKIHEVKTRVVPEITEELLEKLALEGVKTATEFEAHVQKLLADRKETEADQKIRTDIMDALIEGAEMDLPEEMVQMQTDQMLERFGQQLSTQGFDLNQYYQLTGTDEAALRAQMQPDAIKQIKESLVLEEVAIAEKIEATNEEVEAKMTEMSQMYNMDKAALEVYLPNIKEEIKVQKALDFLLANSKQK